MSNFFEFESIEVYSDDSSPLKIWNQWYSATGQAKVNPVAEYILEKLDNEEEKLIIFAHHIAVIDELEEKLYEKKYTDAVVKIIGSTPAIERTDNVERFQNDSNIRNKGEQRKFYYNFSKADRKFIFFCSSITYMI